MFLYVLNLTMFSDGVLQTAGGSDRIPCGLRTVEMRIEKPPPAVFAGGRYGPIYFI